MVVPEPSHVRCPYLPPRDVGDLEAIAAPIDLLVELPQDRTEYVPALPVPAPCPASDRSGNNEVARTGPDGRRGLKIRLRDGRGQSRVVADRLLLPCGQKRE